MLEKIKPKQQLKDIILLFSVPIAIIIVTIGFVYIPRLLAKPSYDFVYCDGYNCERSFSVNSSGRAVKSSEPDYSAFYDAELRYYDISNDSSRPLSESEAQKYELEQSSKSPEGYTLNENESSSGFLFWSSSSNGWTLRKGMAAKPITLESSGYGGQHFIGWVKR